MNTLPQDTSHNSTVNQSSSLRAQWENLSPWTRATIASSLITTLFASGAASVINGEQGITVAAWDELAPHTVETITNNPPHEEAASLSEKTVQGPGTSIIGLQEFARDFHELPLSGEQKKELDSYLDLVLAEAGPNAKSIQIGVVGRASDEDHKTNPGDTDANTGESSDNNLSLAYGRGTLAAFYLQGLVHERGIDDRVSVVALGGEEAILDTTTTDQLRGVAKEHGKTLAAMLGEYNAGEASYSPLKTKPHTLLCCMSD